MNSVKKAEDTVYDILKTNSIKCLSNFSITQSKKSQNTRRQQSGSGKSNNTRSNLSKRSSKNSTYI